MRCACRAVPRSLTVAPGAAVATAALLAHRIVPTITPFTSACTVAVHWQASMVEAHPSRYDLLRRLTRQGMVHLTAAMTVCVCRHHLWSEMAPGTTWPFATVTGRARAVSPFLLTATSKSPLAVSLASRVEAQCTWVVSVRAPQSCRVCASLTHSLNHAHVHTLHQSRATSQTWSSQSFVSGPHLDPTRRSVMLCASRLVRTALPALPRPRPPLLTTRADHSHVRVVNRPTA